MRAPVIAIVVGLALVVSSAPKVRAQVPDAIAAAPGEAAMVTIHAKGAQIYECKVESAGKLTRHDGADADCESKTFEAKRFVNADPDAMREGWDARKQRDWNATYCSDEDWREAIDNGWSIISTLTFRTGEHVSFVAECE